MVRNDDETAWRRKLKQLQDTKVELERELEEIIREKFPHYDLAIQNYDHALKEFQQVTGTESIAHLAHSISAEPDASSDSAVGILLDAQKSYYKKAIVLAKTQSQLKKMKEFALEKVNADAKVILARYYKMNDQDGIVDADSADMMIDDEGDMTPTEQLWNRYQGGDPE